MISLHHMILGLSVSVAPLLPDLLEIDWELLPDVPAQGPFKQGFQDSDGGWIGHGI